MKRKQQSYAEQLAAIKRPDDLTRKFSDEARRRLATPCRESEITCDRNELERLRECNRRLVEALKPSAETKWAYIGEFTQPSIYEDDDDVCVVWTTVKEIMKAILTRATAAKGETDGDV